MRLLYSLLPLFLSLASSAQSDQPFRRANTIVIETNLKGDDAFVKWGRHLAQSGFPIDRSEPHFLSLTTGARDTKHHFADYYVISAITENGVVKINLRWRSKPGATDTAQPSFEDWEYSAMKLSYQYDVYKDFITIVRSFGEYAVRYSKE